MRASGSFCCLLIVAAGLGGCATRAPLACPAASPSRAARVYFATDRQQTASSPILHYGPARQEPAGLDVGWEEVALGPQHQLGKIDGPVAITPRHELSKAQGSGAGDSLQRTDAEITAYMNGTIRQAIRRSSPPRADQPKQVLFFVHGYNTTFDDGLRKAGQLAGDLELVDCAGQARGVPIAYSWPAQGTLLSYLADEENAEWTQQRLVPFLEALARVCREEKAELHLVAHSMGSRALIRSLADIANSGANASGGAKGATRQAIGQIVLLAPDMGRGLFDQYLQRVLPLVKHITIYVSANDRALTLSRILHGGHDRLGLIQSTLFAVPNTVFSALGLPGLGTESHRELSPSAGSLASGKVDMIDVSQGVADVLGHTYEDPSFISDLRELIYNETPAGTGARSNLVPRKASQDVFHTLSSRKVQFFQLENTKRSENPPSISQQRAGGAKKRGPN